MPFPLILIANASLIENFKQIHERVSDRLLELSPDYEQVQLNFHLTSVYDHSLHEAFSKVLHKLVDSLPYLEDLLNVFCAVRMLPVYVLKESDLFGEEFSIAQGIPVRHNI